MQAFKRHSFTLIATALACSALVACSDKSATQSQPAASAAGSAPAAAATSGAKLQSNFVTIATGGASGPYNIIGTALAEVYVKVFGVNSKTQTTGASVENINLIDQKKAEMAFVMSDALADAVNGTGSFQKKIETVSQVAALYPNYVQIVTSGKTGINTIADLKGKRVAVGAQNSGVEVNARTLLNGFGISYDDLKVYYLGYAEAADALKAGRIDAAFLTSGIPNSSLMELQQGFDLKLVSVPAEQLSGIAKDKPYFVALSIPKDTYGNTEDVPTAAIMNALVVRKDMSDDDVYQLTKTFYENLPTLQTAHQAAAAVNLQDGQKNFVAPVHPGAQRYYDEASK